MGALQRQWVKKCAKYFNLCKIPDDQKVDLALMHLLGKAKVWFSSYIIGRKHIEWDDFIVDLCARFRGDMGRQVVEEFNKLHQGVDWMIILRLLRNLRHCYCSRIQHFQMTILWIVSLED